MKTTYEEVDANRKQQIRKLHGFRQNLVLDKRDSLGKVSVFRVCLTIVVV